MCFVEQKKEPFNPDPLIFPATWMILRLLQVCTVAIVSNKYGRLSSYLFPCYTIFLTILITFLLLSILTGLGN